MERPTRKQIILIIISALIVALIIYGFLPGAESVDTAVIQSAPLQVTVEEEGETHVKQQYTVFSPATAFMRRVKLHPGDSVAQGDPLIEMEPPRSAILDPRTQAEADARIEAAEASLDQAETQAKQAINERDRLERLAGRGAATQQQLEMAQMEASRAIGARNVARSELAAAHAAADPATDESERLSTGRTLRAPEAGRILAIHRRSAGHINAGEPLLDIGNIDSLEVRVNVLSQDAVRIFQGMRVVLDQWGGVYSLEAVVTRVEPQGNVQVSALGVEERRVQIIADLASPREEWNGLGSGYRVLAQFVIWEEENVLQVPTSALFRTDEGWAVFVVEDEKAVRKSVSIGHQTGLAAQILEGLSEGDVVIVHPDSGLEDGVQVDPN